MASVDEFLHGSAGLFDWYIDYQGTDEFARELWCYWEEHRMDLEDSLDARRAYVRRRRDVLRVCGQRATAKRQARVAALPYDFTDRDWLDCLDYWNHRCAVCGRQQGLWHTIARAHWIPLADPSCPGTTPGNIVPLCHGVDGCNNKQRAEKPLEWLSKRYTPRQVKLITRRVETYLAAAGQKRKFISSGTLRLSEDMRVA